MKNRILNLVLAILVALGLSLGCANKFGNKKSADVEYNQADELPETGPDEKKPLNFEEEMLLADTLRDAGQHPEAAWHYIRGMQLESENPLPRQRLGYMQLARDVDRAEMIFAELVEKHPDLPSAYVGLGLARIANGEHADAETALETALALDRDSGVAHMGLGMLSDQTGAYEAAAVHYQQAFERDPRRYEIKNNLGMSLMRNGEFQDAVEAFRHAIFIEPRDPALYNNLAIALGHLGSYRAAYDNFRKYSTEADALNNLGYVCLMNGESDRAIKYFERSLLAGPTDRTTVLVNLRAAEDASVAP